MPNQEHHLIKITYTTGMILAGIIFLSSLFSGWLTQSKDVSTVVENQKTLAATVMTNANRLTVLEQAIINTKADVSDIKMDLKSINSSIIGVLLELKIRDKNNKEIEKRK